MSGNLRVGATRYHPRAFGRGPAVENRTIAAAGPTWNAAAVWSVAAWSRRPATRAMPRMEEAAMVGEENLTGRVWVCCAYVTLCFGRGPGGGGGEEEVDLRTIPPRGTVSVGQEQ